jgi:uncharacterized protein (TIGR02147 family)
MSMKASLPNVTAYTDFRAYLKDCYAVRKAEDSKFSHRYFAKKAGHGSSSFFTDIIQGRRQLTTTAALKLAKTLELERHDQEHFLHLVEFNQAPSLEEKNLHYGKLMARGRVKPDILSPDKYAYFAKWYHAALRELLYYFPFRGDFKMLGRQLQPSVPAPKVKAAIQLLEKLGLIRRDDHGVYRQTSALLSTDEMGASMHVENFQVETMRLGIEALERHSDENRDISTLTATLSHESVEKVKHILKETRMKIMAIAEADDKVDRVMQINFQLFPLTKTEKRK